MSKKNVEKLEEELDELVMRFVEKHQIEGKVSADVFEACVRMGIKMDILGTALLYAVRPPESWNELSEFRRQMENELPETVEVFKTICGIPSST